MSIDTAVSGLGYFQDFRPEFRFWHIIILGFNSIHGIR
jgi:hypothetical protein